MVLASMAGRVCFVIMGRTRIKEKRKGANGEVYVTLLHGHLIPAFDVLVAKVPLVEAQHPWIFPQYIAKAHACKKVRNWSSSRCGFQGMQWVAKCRNSSWNERMWGIVSRWLQKRSDLSPPNFEAAMQYGW